MTQHGALRFAFVLCCSYVLKIEPLFPWYIAQLVERSPREQSVLCSWSCPGCEWFVCLCIALTSLLTHTLFD